MYLSQSQHLETPHVWHFAAVIRNLLKYNITTSFYGLHFLNMQQMGNFFSLRCKTVYWLLQCLRLHFLFLASNKKCVILGK